MRLTRLLLTLLAVCCLAGTSRGQEEGFERVELRVVSTSPNGTVTVDRGTSDKADLGDNVVFYPKAGGSVRGVVIQVTDRSAVVELFDRTQVPPSGTRGEIWISSDRFVVETGGREVEVPVESDVPEGDEQPPEHPPWESRDEEWKPGMPLLGEVGAVRPDQREILMTTRQYLSGDGTWTTEDDRKHAFLRAGTSVRVENPFGRGGGVLFDGEANYRYTDVPDFGGENEERLRLDRLSYYRGGTRFDSVRWEAGRFLQYGMPEFGVVDGYEWTKRRPRGDRYGVSVGFMPEPDGDFESGHDFQVAAFYGWVFDAREEFTLDTGYQKTFHNGAADRDLFVTKMQYVPRRRWNYHATAWIDYYTSNDRGKGAGFEVTQFLGSAVKRWRNGSRLSVNLSHLRFPQTDRNEFLPVDLNQLDDDYYDRISVRGAKSISERRGVHAELGGWVDEDESGGDVEFGTDVKDLFAEGGLGDFTVFATRGEFTTVVGARFHYTRDTRGGRWDLFYEISRHDQLEFDADADDLPHHRLRLSRELISDSGSSLSFYAEGQVYDEEAGGSLGFYYQRSF